MKLTPTTGLLGFGAKSLTGLTYSVVPNIWPMGSVGLNYSNLEQLKTFQGGVCVNALLYQWEKNLLNKSGVQDAEWDNQKDKFKNPKGHARGCVAVSWNKETWKDDKWKGPIRYEWLYTIGDETLVTYGLWTTTEHDGRTIYINKHTKESSWKLWKIQNGVTPKNSNFFFGGKEHSGSNPDFATKSEAKWSWDASGYGRKKFSDRTTNYWSSFFAWVSNLNQFDELTKKEGTWTER